MAENYPNLGRDLNYIQEAEKTPKSKNLRKSTPRTIIIRLLKTKDKEK